MTAHFEIRPSRPDDVDQLGPLYKAAFPDEPLMALVRELSAPGCPSHCLSAFREAELAGHIVLTECTVDGSDELVGLLGPLAVSPDYQRQGLGRTLIEKLTQQAEQKHYVRILVLGDPAYYGQFGFQPERGILTPYPLPDEWADAWQSIAIGSRTSPLSGRLCVPAPWQVEGLWR